MGLCNRLAEELAQEEVELLANDPLAEHYSNLEEHLAESGSRLTPVQIKQASMEDCNRLLLRKYIGPGDQDFNVDNSLQSLTPTDLTTSTPAEYEMAQQAIQQEIKKMHEDMDRAFEEEEAKHKTSVYMTGGATASLAAGFASYMLRAGSLMSSFLATAPIWKGFDPVAVLEIPKTGKDKMRPKDKKEDPDKTPQQQADEMFEDDE